MPCSCLPQGRLYNVYPVFVLQFVGRGGVSPRSLRSLAFILRRQLTLISVPHTCVVLNYVILETTNYCYCDDWNKPKLPRWLSLKLSNRSDYVNIYQVEKKRTKTYKRGTMISLFHSFDDSKSSLFQIAGKSLNPANIM